jgi:hypoxanthine phosphoribosyltransferase
MSASKEILYVSWSEIHRALGMLAGKVLLHGKPDVLVIIAKGGLVPGRILADFINIEDIGFIEVKFYKSIGVRGEKPYMKSASLPPLTDKNVLVVDDVVDSGRTMQLVVEYLSGYKVKSTRTLTIYVKPWSSYIPDYYYAQTTKWIIFPWEVCEAMREGVAEKDMFRELSSYCEV